jgi:hypothetical protein
MDNKTIEEVARALCITNGVDPDSPVSVGADFKGEPQWKLFKNEACAAIEAYKAALWEAGLAIVPREPTEVMRDAATKTGDFETFQGESGNMDDIWRAMIAAWRLKE